MGAFKSTAFKELFLIDVHNIYMKLRLIHNLSLGP